MKTGTKTILMLLVSMLPVGIVLAETPVAGVVKREPPQERLLDQMKAPPAWRNYRGIPYEEILVDGMPVDQVQADGIPDEDLKRFKVTPIPKWEAPLPKGRFDPYRKRKYNNHSVNFPKFHWLDEHTLIGEVWRLGDWEAADGELPKVILLDADTGQVKETPYRGEIVCLKADRTLVLSLSKLEGGGRSFQKTSGKLDFSEVRIGKFGDELVPNLPPDQPQIIQLRYARFTRGTCEPEPEHKDFPNGMYLTLYRLWPHGGYVGREDRGDFRLPPGAPLLSRNWVFFDEDKHEIGRWTDECKWVNWPSGQEGIQFLPNLGGYFFHAADRSGQFKMDNQCPYVMVAPGGKIVPLFYTPPLVRKWKGNTVLAVMTAAGPIWGAGRHDSVLPDAFAAANVAWYAMDGFRLVRVLHGEKTRLSPVSPDGCRMLIARAPVGAGKRTGDGEYGYFYRTATIESINFCERGQ